jgi:PAS domain S-box-containing protein
MKQTASVKFARALRQRAEKNGCVPQSMLSPPAPSAADRQRLLHETQVHWFELERQNTLLMAARAQAEAALARYADLYDFAPIGYLTLDPAGEILQVNLKGARILGQPRHRITGRRFAGFVALDSQPAFAALLAQLFEDAGPGSAEVMLHLAADPLRVLRVEASVAQDRQTCRVLVSDITEHRQLEAERAQRQTRLSELSHRLVTVQEDERRSLARVMHEIIAPNLASLMIGLRVFEDELPREHPAAVESAAGGHATRCSKIRMRACRRVGADLRPAVLDFAGLVPALGSYGHQFSRRTGIVFRLVCPNSRQPAAGRHRIGALSHRAGSADQLRQTLRRKDPHHRPRARHPSRHHDGDRRRSRLRSPPGGSRSHPGRGLLSMRQRAEFVGAQWTLESQPGGGTRISVELSLARAQPGCLEGLQDREAQAQ